MTTTARAARLRTGWTSEGAIEIAQRIKRTPFIGVRFYAEIQLRTIAMDTWASLEHEMKYKHDIRNPELIVSELKRCADELAACDLSLQTIRNLIQSDPDSQEKER